MAGFKTHITTSTVLGVGLGSAAYVGFGVPLDQCVLAAGLCSVSGMLPDVDSDNGVPLRESLAFGAAVVPMLLLDRMRHMGLSADTMVLVAAGIYVVVRFGFGELLRRYTVHRGMFHSLPAAAIFAELAFLMCDCPDMSLRLFKAGAVTAGFLSHLVLDEIWSIQVKGVRVRVKRSFGTALKLWGDNAWANLSCYGKLILLSIVCFGEPKLMQALNLDTRHHIANDESADSPALPSPAPDGQPFAPNSGRPARMADEGGTRSR